MAGASIKRQVLREKDLSLKEWKFVKEYMKDFNGYRAAMRAGYGEGRAAQEASKLLREDRIQNALAEEKERLRQDFAISAEHVLVELARIAFGSLRGIFNEDGTLKAPHELDDDTAAAIQSIEIISRNRGGGDWDYVHKFKMHSKTKALELLAKHLGLLEEKVSVTGDNPLALMLAIVENQKLPSVIDDRALEQIAQENTLIGVTGSPRKAREKVVEGKVLGVVSDSDSDAAEDDNDERIRIPKKKKKRKPRGD